MDTRLQQFLQNHRVSVLGILQTDGAIHSAALHVAHMENPFTFLFMTDKGSRKCASLLDGSTQNASLVIGANEDEFATFQGEGKVVIATGDHLDRGLDAYIKKFPDRAGWKHKPDMALLHFTPVWWRYRDMKNSSPIEISSEQ